MDAVFGRRILFSWIVLRIFTSSLVQNVKNSRFGRLDRSLGAVFGLGRGIVFLCLFSFLISAVSPRLFEKSRLMQMSFAGMKTILRQYPELNVFPQKQEQPADGEEAEAPADGETKDSDRKKSAAEYVLNTNVQTKDGEKNLLSAASELIAEGMAIDSGKPIPPELVEIMLRVQLENAAGDEKIQEMSPERQMLFYAKRQNNERKRNENFGNRQHARHLFGGLFQRRQGCIRNRGRNGTRSGGTSDPYGSRCFKTSSSRV